jgi:hypothetical protein
VSVDFVHRQEFQILENTTFRKLDIFPYSDEGRGENNYSVGSLGKKKGAID